MTRVGLISLGCAKNRVDAERILGGLAARGFEIVEDPADAEVVVVNTCGFIRDAVEESVEEILQATLLKTEGNCRVLAVAGCLVKRYPELADELPEVDHFFTPDEIPKIADVIAGSPEPVVPAVEPARILTAPPHSTYLKIAEGCSNRCTYCTIPDIRGPFRSADVEPLLVEAKQLVEQGTVELNLVAQDVTAYGSDRKESGALLTLLDRLEKLDGLRWIRLLYAYPGPLGGQWGGLLYGLMERMASGSKLIPYLDAPIQHAHPRVLRAMGRKTDPETLARFFDTLKKHVPDLVLRTTAIVGFPGETEEEFETLLAFADRVRFHHLGVFAYSPEESTPAEKLPGQIDPDLAWERRDRLLSLQVEISAERNEAFIGRELDVLIEGIDEEGEVLGRTFGQAPEVDGWTRFPDYPDEVVEVGSFVRARISEARPYDLVAEVIEP